MVNCDVVQIFSLCLQDCVLLSVHVFATMLGLYNIYLHKVCLSAVFLVLLL